jgi:hypothetical protein
MRFLLLLIAAVNALSFKISFHLSTTIIRNKNAWKSIPYQPFTLYAKGKKGKRNDVIKPTTGTTSSKGFSSSKKAPIESVSQEVIVTEKVNSNSVDAEEVPDINSVFKKYGIADKEPSSKSSNTGNSLPDEDRPFGQGILDKLSPQSQEKIDRTLTTLVFSSLAVVVSCGVAISLGAFRVVYPDIVIPESLDKLLTDVLTPVFTPSIFAFFACSTTYGLFKFAQISSSKTVYEE